jgi:hypothetical protein
MHNQNRIAHNAFVVLHWFPERSIMHAKFRQCRTRSEPEVVRDKITLGGCGIIGGMERAAERKQKQKSSQQKECSESAVDMNA